MLGTIEVGVIVFLCVVLAILMAPFTPRVILQAFLRSNTILPLAVKYTLMVLLVFLVLKLAGSAFEMQKYAAKKEEVGDDHFAKQEVLLHKFRYERNFYMDSFLVALVAYVEPYPCLQCSILWRTAHLVERKLALQDEIAKAKVK